MLRTGQQYKDGLQKGREIWMDGEQVKEVTTHPACKPIVDVKAPRFNRLHALYKSFDFSGPLDLVKKCADLSDRVDAKRMAMPVKSAA